MNPDNYWKKGQSGNPRGRPKGSKADVFRKMFEDAGENLIKVCLELAANGDGTALKLAMERTFPKLKEAEEMSDRQALLERGLLDIQEKLKSFEKEC